MYQVEERSLLSQKKSHKLHSLLSITRSFTFLQMKYRLKYCFNFRDLCKIIDMLYKKQIKLFLLKCFMRDVLRRRKRKSGRREDTAILANHSWDLWSQWRHGCFVKGTKFYPFPLWQRDTFTRVEEEHLQLIPFFFSPRCLHDRKPSVFDSQHFTVTIPPW